MTQSMSLTEQVLKDNTDIIDRMSSSLSAVTSGIVSFTDSLSNLLNSVSNLEDPLSGVTEALKSNTIAFNRASISSQNYGASLARLTTQMRIHSEEVQRHSASLTNNSSGWGFWDIAEGIIWVGGLIAGTKELYKTAKLMNKGFKFVSPSAKGSNMNIPFPKPAGNPKMTIPFPDPKGSTKLPSSFTSFIKDIPKGFVNFKSLGNFNNLLKGMTGNLVRFSGAFVGFMGRIAPILVRTGTAFTGLMGGMMGGFGILMGFVGRLSGMFVQLAVRAGVAIASMLAGLGPVGWTIIAITLAIAAVIAALVALWYNWDQVVEWAKKAMGSLATMIDNLFTGIFGGIWEGLKDLFAWLLKGVEKAKNWVGALFGGDKGGEETSLEEILGEKPNRVIREIPSMPAVSAPSFSGIGDMALDSHLVNGVLEASNPNAISGSFSTGEEIPLLAEIRDYQKELVALFKGGITSPALGSSVGNTYNNSISFESIDNLRRIEDFYEALEAFTAKA